MTKYNGGWSVFSTVLSGIAIVLLIADLANDAENLSSSFPWILGKFCFYSIFPAIAWLITIIFFKNKEVNPTIKPNNSLQDSEMIELKRRFDHFNSKQTELERKMETIRASLNQGLINQITFNHQMDLLNSEYNWIQKDKDSCKKRNKAIKSLQNEFTNLEALVKDGVLSVDQKMQKRKELIERKMRTM